jgi:hypothetical protein
MRVVVRKSDSIRAIETDAIHPEVDIGLKEKPRASSIHFSWAICVIMDEITIQGSRQLYTSKFIISFKK